MEILPTEDIAEFSFNLPPEAFDSMKQEMRFFGPRSNKALEADLNTRLDQLRQKHSINKILNRLLDGLSNYQDTIYNNFYEFCKNPFIFKSDSNIKAFWELINSFLLDLVERPYGIDSVIMKEPIQNILFPYFEEIGYIVEFRIHSFFQYWFPYFTVTLAKLKAREEKSENFFGYELRYCFERISKLQQSILFGISSFFDPKNTIIRLDDSIINEKDLEPDLIVEKQAVESYTSQNYTDTILDHILFHEKVHYLFHIVFDKYNTKNLSEPKAVFQYLFYLKFGRDWLPCSYITVQHYMNYDKYRI